MEGVFSEVIKDQRRDRLGRQVVEALSVSSVATWWAVSELRNGPEENQVNCSRSCSFWRRSFLSSPVRSWVNGQSRSGMDRGRGCRQNAMNSGDTAAQLLPK